MKAPEEIAEVGSGEAEKSLQKHWQAAAGGEDQGGCG